MLPVQRKGKALMDTEILLKSQLFEGVAKKNIPSIVSCLSVTYKRYEKGEMILREGDNVSNIGILLSGSARSVKTGLSGKQVIVTLLAPGSYIGVLLAASKDRESPVFVQALEASHAIFIPISHILTRSHCPCQAKLLENLLNGIAEKALVLHDRNDCLVKPSIREKVLTFLAREAKKEGANSFKVSMGRDAMAEYLNVDRSALSRELSRMKRDEWIDYHKNWFNLLK